MKWGGIYRVGKFWVVIFRVGIPQGKFDGLDFLSGSFPWGVFLEPLNTSEFWKI